MPQNADSGDRLTNMPAALASSRAQPRALDCLPTLLRASMTVSGSVAVIDSGSLGSINQAIVRSTRMFSTTNTTAYKKHQVLHHEDIALADRGKHRIAEPRCPEGALDRVSIRPGQSRASMPDRVMTGSNALGNACRHDHRAPAQPFGAGGAHIILADDLEEAGARPCGRYRRPVPDPARRPVR